MNRQQVNILDQVGDVIKTRLFEAEQISETLTFNTLSFSLSLRYKKLIGNNLFFYGAVGAAMTGSFSVDDFSRSAQTLSYHNIYDLANSSSDMVLTSFNAKNDSERKYLRLYELYDEEVNKELIVTEAPALQNFLMGFAETGVALKMGERSKLRLGVNVGTSLSDVLIADVETNNLNQPLVLVGIEDDAVKANYQSVMSRADKINVFSLGAEIGFIYKLGGLGQ